MSRSNGFSSSTFAFGLLRTMATGLPWVFAASICGVVMDRLLPPSWLPSWHLRSVTNAAMTSYLRKAGVLGPATFVAKMHWEPLTGGALATVFRVTLSYRGDDCTSAPSTVIVKSFGSRLKDRFMSLMFNVAGIEGKAYTFLRPFVKAYMPRIFAVHYSEPFSSMLAIMEDVSDLRAKKSSTVEGCTVDEARIVLHSLGAVHGSTWGNRSIVLRFVEAANKSWFVHSFPRTVEQLLPSLTEYPAFQALVKDVAQFPVFRFVQRHMRGRSAFDRCDEGSSSNAPVRMPLHFVVTHGDVRLENIFFDDARKSCVFIDWQLCLPHHPIEDVAFFFGEVASGFFDRDPDLLSQLLADYRAGVASAHPSGDCPLSTAELKKELVFGMLNNAVRWVYFIANTQRNKQANTAVDVPRYLSRMDYLTQVLAPAEERQRIVEEALREA